MKNALSWIMNQQEKSADFTGLCFTSQQANSTISMQAVGSPPSITLETSTDGQNWTSFVVGTTTITLEKYGDKVYFRCGASGNTTFSTSTRNYYKFVMTGIIAGDGNIMSLISRNYEEVTEMPCDYCFTYLFSSCNSLVSSPILTPTTLRTGCYYRLFYICSYLTRIRLLYTGNFISGAPQYAFQRWTVSVPGLGTINYNGNDRTTGYDAIPTNWTVEPF